MKSGIGLAANAIIAVGTSSPNIVLIFPDQWRFDWAGFDEPDVQAPNIAALASKGTRFTHAYVPAPLCAPSRGALASGREYDESPIKGNMQDFPTSNDNIFKRLQTAGYHTMVTGKDHLTMKSGVSMDGSYQAAVLGFSDQGRTLDKFEDFMGTSAKVSWKGQTYDGYAAQSKCYGAHGMGDCCTDQKASKSYMGSENGYICPTTDIGDDFYMDNWVEHQAEELLDRKPKDKPWFLWVSFPGPHPPFILTERMMATVEGRSFPVAEDNSLHSAEYQLQFRRSYAAEIENIDRLIGKLMTKIDVLGETSNTLFILSSDHGDELGDHGNLGKTLPWDGDTHVPLIFSGPGVKAGQVLNSPVGTLDIGGTMLEVAGSLPGVGMTTKSLWPLLSGSTNVATRDFVSSGLAASMPGQTSQGWRAVIRSFNESTVLKLVCCMEGCTAGSYGSLKLTGTSPQVGLFNITEPHSETRWGNVLNVGHAEADELVALMPSAFASACRKVSDGAADAFV